MYPFTFVKANIIYMNKFSHLWKTIAIFGHRSKFLEGSHYSSTQVILVTFVKAYSLTSNILPKFCRRKLVPVSWRRSSLDISISVWPFHNCEKRSTDAIPTHLRLKKLAWWINTQHSSTSFRVSNIFLRLRRSIAKQLSDWNWRSPWIRLVKSLSFIICNLLNIKEPGPKAIVPSLCWDLTDEIKLSA